jgi:anti-sigma factor RsiW
MRCARVRKRLAAYVDGQLRPAERQGVEYHVEACETCRAALAGLVRLDLVLQETSVPPVPGGLAAETLRQARLHGNRPWPGRAHARSPRRWWITVPVPVRVAAAAAMLGGLAVGTLIGRDMWRPQAPSPSLQASADPAAVYFLDYLGDTPNGSLADRYLKLAMVENGGSR